MSQDWNRHWEAGAGAYGWKFDVEKELLRQQLAEARQQLAVKDEQIRELMAAAREERKRPRTVTNHTTNHHTNTTNHHNNVTLVAPFGKEEAVDEARIRQLLGDPRTSVSQLVKLKHFDKAASRNVRLRNKRGSTVEVVREEAGGEKKWVHEDRKTIVEELFDAGRLDLLEVADGDEEPHGRWLRFDDSVMAAQDSATKEGKRLYREQLSLVDRALMSNA